MLDESLRGEESVVFLGELLDKLLVFVQPFLLLVMELLERQKNYFLRSSTDMYSSSICLARSISAASARMQSDMRGRGTLGSLWSRSVNKRKERLVDALDGSGETFVPLGIVVLETDLQFNGLYKVALLFAIGVGEQLLYRAPHA